MAECQIITYLYVVTDTETGQEKIGDIEGGRFDPAWLRSHVAMHGSAGLLETFAYMTYHVMQAQRDYNSRQQKNAVAVAPEVSN